MIDLIGHAFFTSRGKAVTCQEHITCVLPCVRLHIVAFTALENAAGRIETAENVEFTCTHTHRKERKKSKLIQRRRSHTRECTSETTKRPNNNTTENSPGDHTHTHPHATPPTHQHTNTTNHLWRPRLHVARVLYEGELIWSTYSLRFHNNRRNRAHRLDHRHQSNTLSLLHCSVGQNKE